MSEAGPAEVGPWAREKLDALGHYLDYYTKVLKNQRWRTIYLDAFAGGGQAMLRANSPQAPAGQGTLLGDVPDDLTSVEERRLIDGSPKVALDVANPFDRYVFVEPSPRRHAELESLVAGYGDTRTVSLRRSTAEEGIAWLLERNVSPRTHRGVAFLDPFGTQLPWSSVEALGRSDVFEIVVNVALHTAVMRMMPNSGVVDPTWRPVLDRFFGTADWYDIAYGPPAQGSLLGDDAVAKPEGYERALLDFYRSRLRAAFGRVSEPMAVRNTRGVPLYYLLWAGSHEKGLQGAQYVLGMGECLPRR